MEPDFFNKKAQDLKLVLEELVKQIHTLTREHVLEQLDCINHFVATHKLRFTGPQKLAEYIKRLVTPYISGSGEPDREVLEKLFSINQALLKKTDYKGNAATVQFKALQSSLASEFLQNRVLKLHFSRRLAQNISDEIRREHNAHRTSAASKACAPSKSKRVIFISETHIRDPEVYETVKILFSNDPDDCLLCFDPEILMELCQQDPTIKSIDIIGHAPNVLASMHSGFVSSVEADAIPREARITLGSFKDSKAAVAIQIAALISHSHLAQVEQIRIISCAAGTLDEEVEIPRAEKMVFSGAEHGFSRTSVAGVIWANISTQRKSSGTQLSLWAPPYIISPVPATESQQACLVASEPGEFLWTDGKFKGYPKKPVTLMWAIQTNHEVKLGKTGEDVAVGADAPVASARARSASVLGAARA